MMLQSKAYNLSVTSLPKVRLFRGKELELVSLYIYCSANSTFDLYFKESKSNVNSAKTYYIYKDEKLYAGKQYNKMLPEYDAALRDWIQETKFDPIKFNFPSTVELFFELKTTGGAADIIATFNIIQ